MSENLNNLLEMLKREIMGGGGVALLPQKALEQFHGLTLHQLVLLTDAPALGVTSERRGADGGRIEAVAIEGKDAGRCDAAAHQILLDDRLSLAVGDTLQVSVAAAGGPRRVLVRDHNGVVYRIVDNQAVVDEELTTAFRPQRRSDPFTQLQRDPQHQGAADASALHELASEVLAGLAGARARNGTMVETIQKMIWSAGEQALRPACEAASPQLLQETFEQIIVASQQLESLLDGLVQRTRASLPQTSESQDPAIGQLQLPIGARSTPAANLPTEPSSAASFTLHPRESQPF